MNCIVWSGKNEVAKAVWTPDLDTASILYKALKRQGYAVKWTQHIPEESKIYTVQECKGKTNPLFLAHYSDGMFRVEAEK